VAEESLEKTKQERQDPLLARASSQESVDVFITGEETPPEAAITSQSDAKMRASRTAQSREREIRGKEKKGGGEGGGPRLDRIGEFIHTLTRQEGGKCPLKKGLPRLSNRGE